MIKTGKINHKMIYEFTISVNINIENQLDFSFISKWKYIKEKKTKVLAQRLQRNKSTHSLCNAHKNT